MESDLALAESEGNMGRKAVVIEMVDFVYHGDDGIEFSVLELVWEDPERPGVLRVLASSTREEAASN